SSLSHQCVRRKRFLLTSSRTGAPVWTRRTQSLHQSKKNRRNPGVIRTESS
ncbi:unnamed protein product, partial [Tetraodon nigroviridis]